MSVLPAGGGVLPSVEVPVLLLEVQKPLRRLERCVGVGGREVHEERALGRVVGPNDVNGKVVKLVSVVAGACHIVRWGVCVDGR